MYRLKLVKDETSVDFLGRARIAVLGSCAAVLLSLVALIGLGLNFGIDFRGGVLVEARLTQPADLGALRGLVGGLDLGDVTIQEFGQPTDVLIRVESQPGGGDAQKAAENRIVEALTAAYQGVEIRRTSIVGPKVSGELIQAGVIAVLTAVLAVLGYIWLRFEWQFSVGAVAALVHDVAITLGVFALLQLEFNLSIVAALLTIVGYSLNDTVVVFDRVRENLRRFKTTELGEVLNISINQTLSRTLMTSATTLLALIALYVLGGEVIRGFTFAMIFGVVVGTYSSIFIASPVLLFFGVNRDLGEDGSGAGVQFGGAEN
ncbi:MAG: protein translocase subunit SecF [Pseudomonadota bacterium]